MIITSFRGQLHTPPHRRCPHHLPVTIVMYHLHHHQEDDDEDEDSCCHLAAVQKRIQHRSTRILDGMPLQVVQVIKR